MQLHQVTIAQGTGQVFLNFLAAAVDQAQLLLVHRGGAVQNLVHKAHLLFSRKAAHPAGSEIRQYGGIYGANRGDGGLGQQNTKGNGGVYAFGGTVYL